MRIKLLTQQPKVKVSKVSNSGKEDLLDFVSKQFKELAKKNISVPIQLFQL